jgi:hypothetical protein
MRERGGGGRRVLKKNVLYCLSSLLSPSLSLFISLSHAQSFENLSLILSVSLAQMIKALQWFCFPTVLEFNSRPSQISFKIIKLIGRIS